ncbi:hypothetical protein Salat_1686300 [Sesamum alatum]|uniref:Uncharacterized protein n=1 Tax=Sesamum alatum TaxID=300844 RepID=A0AAE1Y7K3_9LAMI|nr:hypothetical protein Salat_1686300 [Sesamum alatum]
MATAAAAMDGGSYLEALNCEPPPLAGFKSDLGPNPPPYMAALPSPLPFAGQSDFFIGNVPIHSAPLQQQKADKFAFMCPRQKSLRLLYPRRSLAILHRGLLLTPIPLRRLFSHRPMVTLEVGPRSHSAFGTYDTHRDDPESASDPSSDFGS